ncbi:MULTISPECIES: hypothetical protein [Gluconobacter]|uniref:Uncharacterized protein n=1 Tax=Gluconobacter cerinus TaxID=38307 RepID=A0A1B6VFL8_9PROT|nr:MULTISPECIES: hypothetical protein [Gluconobacter]MBS1035656.1 FAD-binding oxidoreductase [Gluconobacter cerinus]OAJ65996.1 hypothetical protein A0123_03375 [Gluconobacter cerinus]
MTATAKTSKTEPAAEAKPRRPRLIVAIGRQRVGKTTILKAITEITLQQGGDPQVWNTDIMNKSHAIDTVGVDVLTPPEQHASGQAAWLEEQIMGMAQTGRDAVLDIGGGWTAVHELIQGSPLLGAMRRMKVRLIPYFVIGFEPADLDYLDDLHRRDFNPPGSVVIINEGLASYKADSKEHTRAIIRHPAVQQALTNKGTVATFPAVNGLLKVAERNQSFFDFVAGKPVSGMPTPSWFDTLRFDFWLRHSIPAFMRDLGADFLPNMPNGLPPVVSKDEIENGDDGDDE